MTATRAVIATACYLACVLIPVLLWAGVIRRLSYLEIGLAAGVWAFALMAGTVAASDPEHSDRSENRP